MTSAQRNLRTFYILILTQTFSLIGSRISSLAVGIWVFNQTGSATPLALVAFFATAPSVLASSISGVLADRWDRRYVMMLADAGQAIGTLLLLASFASDSFQLWHLYSVAVIQSVFSVFQGPAFSASVTMLVPDSQRDRANAILQITGPMAGIVAPALAGMVYALVSVEGAIAFDLLTFVTAMAVVFGVHIPRPTETAAGRAARGSVWKEVMGGLSYLRQQQTLFGLIMYASLINFMFNGAMVLTTPYVLARIGDEKLLGLLLSVNSIGAVAGGVIFGIWGGTRPRIHTIMPAILIMGTCLALFGMAQSALVMAAILFVMMLPNPMANASFMSMLQAKVPPDIQGRVFAVVMQIAMLLSPVSLLLVGPLVDRVFEPAVAKSGWEAVAPLVGDAAGAGMGLIYLIAGAVVAITAALIYALPAVRHMEAGMSDYEDAPQEAASDAVSLPAETAAL